MLSRRHAWVVALAATLTMTVSYIDRQTLAVLGPTVTEALGMTETEWGWLSSAFSFAYLVATPLGGWLIGRVGARRGLVGSVLVWSTVAALHAVVPGFGVLFALRIALGLAEGPSFPGAAQTVQRVLPTGDRARGFGVLFSGSSIGGMLVPPLASFVFGIAGWRVAFLITAVVGLLWIPIWIAVTSHPDVRAQIDAPAEVATSPGRSPRAHELLRRPSMIRALIAVFAAAPVIGMMLAWGAKYLHRTFGVVQEDVGYYLWLPPLMFDVGAILFGDLASRLRPTAGEVSRGLYWPAMVLATATVLLPAIDDPWLATVVIGVGVLGSGGLYSLCTADVLSRVPSDSVPLAGGILACAQSVALIAEGPIIGAAVDHYGNYDVVAVAIGLWAIPGSLIWIAWKPRS